MHKKLFVSNKKVKPGDLSYNKTILDDLLEKFPNVKLDNGIPVNICPDYLGYIGCERCIHDCIACWNSPFNDTEQA